jgi:uncharacterized protein
MMTLLHAAAASGDPVKMRMLLSDNPDVNVRTDPNGFTPLHICVSSVFEDSERQEVIRQLCASGIDKEAKTYDKGVTALQLAAMRNKPLCIQTLIECGANIHATEGNGATALHGAAYFGYDEVVKILIDAGADPNLQDKNGLTPLSLARMSGHNKIVEFMNSKKS